MYIKRVGVHKKSDILTIPNATPVNAVWNSKLGVGFSGVGYAKSNKKLSANQNDVTATKVKYPVKILNSQLLFTWGMFDNYICSAKKGKQEVN